MSTQNSADTVYESVQNYVRHDLSESFTPWSAKELEEKNKEVRYKFSSSSLKKLEGLHPALVDIIFEVANSIDLTIVYGLRTAEEQHKLYLAGRSSKDGYIKKSRHQSGKAVDILPRPRGVNMYNSKDRDNPTRWAYFTGFFQATALALGYETRVGWKWRTDPMEVLKRPLRENSLVDPNHFEIYIR